MRKEAAATAASSAAESPEVPRTQAVPAAARAVAWPCTALARVKSITTSQAAASASTVSPLRVPPASGQPAPVTSSTSNRPMRPDMPATPMRQDIKICLCIVS
jgi:hypothetical protein